MCVCVLPIICVNTLIALGIGPCWEMKRKIERIPHSIYLIADVCTNCTTTSQTQTDWQCAHRKTQHISQSLRLTAAHKDYSRFCMISLSKCTAADTTCSKPLCRRTWHNLNACGRRSVCSAVVASAWKDFFFLQIPRITDRHIVSKSILAFIH